ncbi:hypothetical protein [Rhodococcus erythropolis]|uniref:hypothetical protein n=1 Tax=Rhodococcus erythropolis TaxID=1833 RepID=UPI0022B345B6|nr:hypothetical protein [Rhodococcus erythropolis]MCZ4570344.1 hypothetical protein [Rhodococcus erythropolis]
MNSGQPRETDPRVARLRARSIRPRDPNQSKATLGDKPESPGPKENPINWTSILGVVAGIVTVASLIISLFWSASLVKSTVEVAEKQITAAADQRLADVRSEAYAQVMSDLDILQGHVARLKTIFTDATFLEPGDLIASARTDIARARLSQSKAIIIGSSEVSDGLNALTSALDGLAGAFDRYESMLRPQVSISYAPPPEYREITLDDALVAEAAFRHVRQLIITTVRDELDALQRPK